ncbi:MAG TPA: hypothetical protein VMG30_04710 [Acidobacteriota bacterium]|nr:hypothetical protein [Acidobacteriota bacterium]
MSFDERYQLLELAGEDGAKTFVAKEIATGKKVTVFLFVGEQAHAQQDFLAKLREVDRAQFPELIDTGDNRGTIYVVTEPVGNLAELKTRLSRFHAAASEAPAHKPGEFTKAGVWHVPAELKSAPAGSPKVSRESGAVDMHAEEQTPAHSAAGSFTQMFQAPAAPIGEPAAELPIAPAPPPVESRPGSFTQMFQAAPAPIGEPAPEASKPPTPQPAPAPAPSAPGSFTQMFQAAAAPIGEPAPGALKPPTPQPAPTPAPSAPGSFTQVFEAAAAPIGESVPQGSKASTPPVPPKQAQSGPGEFTRFFSAASSPAPTPAPMPQKPESQGEFARVFGSGDRATVPPTSFTGIFGQPSSASAPKQSETIHASKPPQSFAPAAGEFTKIFGDSSAEIPPLGPVAPLAESSPASPAASAPGEYTRMFSAQSLPQELATEPVPAPTRMQETPVPAKQPSKMIPVLIIVILVLLAVIAIIVVTARK